MLTASKKPTITDRIKAILSAIHQEPSAKEISHPSLFKGLAGDVLFAWYSRKFDSSLVNGELFDEQLGRLQDSATAVRTQADMSDGITGVAWLFELLLAEAEEPYAPTYNSNVDTYLGRVVTGEGWNGELEYVLGLAGIAVYAARRARQSQDISLYAKVVEAFEQHAEWKGDRCAWATPDDSAFRLEAGIRNPDERQYNLGLAHGIPGIIAALIPALDISVLKPRACRMVSGACDWLIEQKQDAASHGSYFGSLAGEGYRSRLGWCYGDLPIALTLIRAGKALGRGDWIAFARKVVEHAAGRSAEEGAIRDAGLCHGSAGVFLMFELIHRQLPNPVFSKAATFWLHDVLDRFDLKGIRGFDTFRINEQTGQPYSLPLHDFLSGYGGIGLCLTVAGGIEPHWIDGILLG